MGKNNFNKNVATAPYNFVPLNSNVIYSDNDSSVITGIHDRYDYLERLTGYIECKLETLTPIYIRGGLTKEEVKAKKEAKDNSNFFSPAGQICIPGSSLRGMIRTLVEIASWGKFGFFEDRNLYFRGFADKCKNLREEYDSQMKPYDKESKSSIYKMSAGYMIKEGFRYFIYPAEKTGSKDKQFYNIKIEEASEEIEKNGKEREIYNYYKLKDGRSIVVSGPMSNYKNPELSKKHDWIINKIDINIQNRIEIPETDIQNYNRDETRGNKVPNILKQCYDDKEVPCFYVEWLDDENNKRVSFGNTALFRISYQKSIGDHIPINGIENKEKIDFANAIFGNTFEGEQDPDINPIAGRVFFEDAKLVNPNNNCLMNEETLGILL
ncbi:MAG: TIGR03986 family type III CRISPR-associated RAMP protein, partial [Methanosarcina sp.]